MIVERLAEYTMENFGTEHSDIKINICYFFLTTTHVIPIDSLYKDIRKNIFKKLYILTSSTDMLLTGLSHEFMKFFRALDGIK
jgi:hypothetical protein